MKSVKVFLVLMLILYLGLFFFDYLKGFVFPVKHHGVFVWLKTAFMVVAGISIMKFTLEKRVFKIFITIYASIWVIYYILKWITKFSGPSEFLFSANKLMLFYLNITQILTPFPFFFFWILNRAFKEISGKKEI